MGYSLITELSHGFYCKALFYHVCIPASYMFMWHYIVLDCARVGKHQHPPVMTLCLTTFLTFWNKTFITLTPAATWALQKSKKLCRPNRKRRGNPHRPISPRPNWTPRIRHPQEWRTALRTPQQSSTIIGGLTSCCFKHVNILAPSRFEKLTSRDKNLSVFFSLMKSDLNTQLFFLAIIMHQCETVMYSQDLNPGHLNTRNIWIPVWYSNDSLNNRLNLVHYSNHLNIGL